jgi:hypothetical protein
MPASPYGIVLASPKLLSRAQIAERAQVAPHEVDAALAGYVERGEVSRVAVPGSDRVYYRHVQARLYGADR